MNGPTKMFAAHRRSETRTLGHGRSRYGDGRRVNWVAMLLSAASGVGLLAFLAALEMDQIIKVGHPTTIVEMLSEPPPPAPPPSPREAMPVETIVPRSPVVAPAPLVPTIMPPPQMSTSPAPVPEVPAAPAAAPSPAPVAPAIENAGDLSSKMIEARPPRYPLDSRRKHEEGTVVLSVLLGTDGRVTEISISRSSGSERLDRAALDAVRRWRWSPTRRGGVPVMVRGLVEIPFQLTRS